MSKLLYILFYGLGLISGLFVMAFIVIKQPFLISTFLSDNLGKDIIEGFGKEENDIKDADYTEDKK